MSERSVKLKAVLSLGILIGLGAVSTLAAWTGTATATSSITAATVSLGIGKDSANATATSYTIPLSGTQWYPGTSMAALVTVKNTSTVPVAYSVKGTVTETGAGTLGNAMKVVLKTSSSVAGTAPNLTCSGVEERLSKAAQSNFSSTQTSMGTLAAAGIQTYCVELALPMNAASTLQGNTTKIDLVFTASVGS